MKENESGIMKENESGILMHYTYYCGCECVYGSIDK